MCSLTSSAEQQQFYSAHVVVICTATLFSCWIGSQQSCRYPCHVTADEVLWWVTIRLIHMEDVIPLIHPAKNGQGSKKTTVNRTTWMICMCQSKLTLTLESNNALSIFLEVFCACLVFKFLVACYHQQNRQSSANNFSRGVSQWLALPSPHSSLQGSVE